MKTYKKIYIGKGKKVANLDIIKISFNIADIMELTHEYKGENYLSFEVAKMIKPDQFENEYTVYVNKLEEAPVPEEASQVGEPARHEAKGHSSNSKSKKTKAQKEVGKKSLEANHIPSDEIPF